MTYFMLLLDYLFLEMSKITRLEEICPQDDMTDFTCKSFHTMKYDPY